MTRLRTVNFDNVAASPRPFSPHQVLTLVSELSGIPLELLQSPTQLRQVGQVRAAAAHLLRTQAGLPVKEVAPLLGRSDQTVCEFSRKARLALANGGKIAELIEQASLVLSEAAAAASAPDIAVGDSSLAPGLVPQRRARAMSTPPILPTPNLAEWRTRAGLSQAQLAQRSGIARETIARIEKGRPARRDLILRLADALLLAPSALNGTADLDALTGEAYKACKTCGALKPVRAFVPVKGTPYVYLRCRACRARRARERYYSSPEIHEAEVARARKNGKARRLRRRLQASGRKDGLP